MAQFNALCIADIHFGALNGNKLLNELEKSFIRKLDKDESIDMVAICGDLTDKALSYNDSSINNLLLFINRIASICEDKGIMIRIIKGTNTHDRDQLENYRYLEERPNLNFKIINEMTIEEINITKKKSISILYLPEYYDIDYESIPDDIDFCFGHGDLSFLNYGSRVLSRENSFMANKLMDKIKHCGIFGHYHQFQNYKDKLFYTGSFSRWVFGEENKKGFIKLTYNSSNDDFNIKFIENKLCDQYVTADITSIINEDGLDDANKVRRIIKTIDHLKEEWNDNGKRTVNVRVNINHKQMESDDGIENSNRIIELVIKQRNDLKLNVIRNKDMISENEDENGEEELRNTEYDFLFSDELDTLTKIKRYLKIKYDKELSLERLQTFLSND